MTTPKNPLLHQDPPDRPAAIQALFDAIIQMQCMWGLFTSYYAEAVRLWELEAPEPEDWPEMAEVRRQKKERILAWERERERERLQEKGCEEDTVITVPSSEWAELLMNLSTSYLRWCEAVHAAVEAVAPAMAARAEGVPALPEEWFIDLRADLRAFAGPLHPVTVGEDGMGLVRMGCPPLPDGLSELLASIRRRCTVLMDVRRNPAAAAPPEPPSAPGHPGYRFPRTRAAFLALVDLGIAGKQVADQLEAALRLVDRCPMPSDLGYLEPLECRDPPRPYTPEDLALERREREEVPEGHRMYFRHFDAYHRAQSAFRIALQGAREAVDAAAPELDVGLVKLGDLESMKIAAELSALGGIVARPLTAGPYPNANEPDTPERLRRQLGILLEWENRLRPYAHAKQPAGGAPDPPAPPAAQPQAGPALSGQPAGNGAAGTTPAPAIPASVIDQLRRLQNRFEACYASGKRLTIMVARRWEIRSGDQRPVTWREFEGRAGHFKMAAYIGCFDDAGTGSRADFRGLVLQAVDLLAPLPGLAGLGPFGRWFAQEPGRSEVDWAVALAEAAADRGCGPVTARRRLPIADPATGWPLTLLWDPEVLGRDLEEHPDWRRAVEALALPPDAYVIDPVGDAFLASAEAIAAVLSTHSNDPVHGKPAATPSGEAASSIAAEPEQVSAVVLDKDDLSILGFLAASPMRLFQVAEVLPTGGPRDRKNIGQRLRAMEKSNLVERPKGPRKGYRISQLGLAALRSSGTGS